MSFIFSVKNISVFQGFKKCIEILCLLTCPNEQYAEGFLKILMIM